MNSLNQSDESKSFDILNKNWQIESFTFNGFKGLQPKNQENPLCQYLAYRCNDYMEEIDKDQQLEMLLKINGNKNGDTTSNAIINLKDIEITYLLFYKTDNSSYKNQLLDTIRQKLRIYPSSKRLMYLSATMSYYLKDFTQSIPVYQNLLRSNYYTYKILRILIAYYKTHNIDSSNFYSDYLKNNLENANWKV